MEKLFGTDGIRGAANVYPITPEMMIRVGRAVVQALQPSGRPARIIIGKDSRVSGDMIECAVASGSCSASGNVFLAGVLPTPAIAYLSHAAGFDAGIMISASHNPFTDNGIKIFNKKGFKLSDKDEDAIEHIIWNERPATGKPAEQVGAVVRMNTAAHKYLEFLKTAIAPEQSLRGFDIILDCSNGATSEIAPQVFKQLGAGVRAICHTPDGRNINQGCGSQHPEALAAEVVKHGADMGLAFDGDGDRLIAVDENGKVVRGDQILLICAKYLKQHAGLTNNLVVTTVMSNVGLYQALNAAGIDHVTADVGDRYVLEKMRRHDAVIGGEDSGHMIFLDQHTSGDGIFTALRLIQAVKAAGKPLSQLAGAMKVYPQVLMNIKVKQKTPIDSVPEIAEAIRTVKEVFKDQGRVLVRYSGTQPLCRVMVEGPDEQQTKSYCRKLADLIQQELGI